MRRFGIRAGRRFASAQLSAMQLVPSLVAWWEPGRGMTVAEVTTTGIQNYTGLKAPPFTETTAASHFADLGYTGSTRGPVIHRHTAVVGIRRYLIVVTQWTTNYAVFDLQTGAVSVEDGGVAATYSGGVCSVYDPDGVGGTVAYIMPSVDTTLSGYYYTAVVDALACSLSASVIIQHRCSALADQSGHAYDLVQATAASQPFVQKADGSSPGGNLFTSRAAIWQPNDAAKTAACGEDGLCTAMTTDHTFVADVYITAAATAAVPLLATAGGVAIIYGIDTSRRPYVTCGTTLTGTALAVGRHQLAFVRSGNTWSLYADKVIDGSPTELTPGGAITPTSVTLTQRCMGYVKGGIGGTAMTAAQIAAEHTAMARE